MKQAILIMAHKNRAQIEKLVRYFDGQCDIFIHIDKKSKALTAEDEKVLASLPGVVQVSRKIAVHWGGFSLLRCQLYLLEQAMRHSDCRYIHLLSAQDYPLQPLVKFLRFFDMADKEYIGGTHLPAPNWDNNTYKRFQYYFFTDWFKFSTPKQVKWMWDFADKQKKWGIKRRLPKQVDHLYGGSAWFSLTRTCTEALLDYTKKHPALLRRYKYTFVPDEMYIHTVVWNIDFPHKKMGYTNYRYIHWAKQGDSHPVNFDESYLHELSSTEAFFARKYEYPTCERLVELTDKYMLTSEELTSTETGAWTTHTFVKHFYDGGLAQGIIKLCQICEVKDVIDLGCGPGWYVTALRKKHIPTVGYDGNPNTTELSQLLAEQAEYPCEQADLTDELMPEEPYDMVLCLSVGEYIPEQYEEQVWKNLNNATGKYLVLSWGSPKYPAEGTINLRSEEYIIERAAMCGLKVDKLATQTLRDHSWLQRYKDTVLVFRK